jgi:hypothetical protein
MNASAKQLRGVYQRVTDVLEGGKIAEESVANHRCGNGRDDYRRELGNPEITQDYFDGKQRPCNGRIESPGDSGGGPATHERTQALLVDLEPLTDR